MAESHVVSGLVSKRSELTGLVLHHQREIERLQTSVGHLDVTIKLFAPEFDLRTVRAKAVRTPRKGFGKGSASRMLLEALRDLGGSASPRQIAQVIFAGLGEGADEKGTFNSVLATLRRVSGTGAVLKGVKAPDGGYIWHLASLDQQISRST